jgi:hypothetical protein
MLTRYYMQERYRLHVIRVPLNVGDVTYTPFLSVYLLLLCTPTNTRKANHTDTVYLLRVVVYTLHAHYCCVVTCDITLHATRRERCIQYYNIMQRMRLHTYHHYI